MKKLILLSSLLLTVTTTSFAETAERAVLSNEAKALVSSVLNISNLYGFYKTNPEKCILNHRPYEGLALVHFDKKLHINVGAEFFDFDLNSTNNPGKYQMVANEAKRELEPDSEYIGTYKSVVTNRSVLNQRITLKAGGLIPVWVLNQEQKLALTKDGFELTRAGKSIIYRIGSNVDSCEYIRIGQEEFKYLSEIFKFSAENYISPK